MNYFKELGLDYEADSLYVGNNPRGKCPIYYNEFEMEKIVQKTNMKRCNLILLSMEDTSYWCQLSYQLAHELCHYEVFVHNCNNRVKLKWVEETICEAFSLYFLDYVRKNWSRISLSRLNSGFGGCFDKYLKERKDEAAKGTNRLSNISTAEELLIIDSQSEIQREDRAVEMLNLYLLMKGTDIEGLVSYRDFVNETTRLLDTSRYRKKYKGNDAVDYLCKIQEMVM